MFNGFSYSVKSVTFKNVPGVVSFSLPNKAFTKLKGSSIEGPIFCVKRVRKANSWQNSTHTPKVRSAEIPIKDDLVSVTTWIKGE